MYLRGIVEGNNDLLKEIVKEMIKDGDSKWMKTTKKYCTETGTKIEAICSNQENKEDIEKLIKVYDTNRWVEEVNSKSSLTTYKKYKKCIKEEKEYDNTQGSALLYKARANVLPLNDRKRHQN